MEKARWLDLMKNDDLPLSAEEIKAGWHFCWEFDGLLVGPGMCEMEFCSCVPQGGQWKG